MQYTFELKRSLLELYSKQKVVTVRSQQINHVGFVKNISSECVMLTIPFPFEVKNFRFDEISQIVGHG